MPQYKVVSGRLGTREKTYLAGETFDADETTFIQNAIESGQLVTLTINDVPILDDEPELKPEPEPEPLPEQDSDEDPIDHPVDPAELDEALKIAIEQKNKTKKPLGRRPGKTPPPPPKQVLYPDPTKNDPIPTPPASRKKKSEPDVNYL